MQNLFKKEPKHAAPDLHREAWLTEGAHNVLFQYMTWDAAQGIIVNSHTHCTAVSIGPISRIVAVSTAPSLRAEFVRTAGAIRDAFVRFKVCGTACCSVTRFGQSVYRLGVQAKSKVATEGDLTALEGWRNHVFFQRHAVEEAAKSDLTPLTSLNCVAGH